MPTERDREIIRRLAAETAEIAALPVHAEKLRLWRLLNGLRPERPMVMVDQVCWNEMEVDGELTLLCEDAECRNYEWQLRRQLYQWSYFPVDMVVEPLLRVPKAIQDTGFGVQHHEQIAVTDPTSGVVGHCYENQFLTDADLEKIQMPVITHDAAETARRMEVAHELFDGLLETVEYGWDPYFSVWDPLATWMSVEGALYGLADRPEFMLQVVTRIVQAYLTRVDQLEEQGLLCHHQPLIHCTGAWTDELPAPGFDPAHPRAQDLWLMGLAQMLATVSPAMFDKFEIDPCLPMFERFGLVYYGCCDPLDKKMAQVRKIPHLRKVSMSPWVDEELGAAEIGGDYVYSRKPNPALLAWPSFDEQAARQHIQTTVDACARHGCPLELIFKDISTVRYQPQRLWQWSDITMEVVQG